MCCEEFRRKVVQKFGGAIAGDYRGAPKIGGYYLK